MVFANFFHFEQLQQAQNIKIRKIATQCFKKSVSRVSIPKIMVLAQMLRSLYFSLNLSWKLPTFQNALTKCAPRMHPLWQACILGANSMHFGCKLQLHPECTQVHFGCIWKCTHFACTCILGAFENAPILHARAFGVHLGCIWRAAGVHFGCSWRAAGVHFGCSWRAFWVRWRAFWVHLACILGAFGVQFGCIWRAF